MDADKIAINQPRSLPEKRRNLLNVISAYSRNRIRPAVVQNPQKKPKRPAPEPELTDKERESKLKRFKGILERYNKMRKPESPEEHPDGPEPNSLGQHETPEPSGIIISFPLEPEDTPEQILIPQEKNKILFKEKLTEYERNRRGQRDQEDKDIASASPAITVEYTPNQRLRDKIAEYEKRRKGLASETPFQPNGVEIEIEFKDEEKIAFAGNEEEEEDCDIPDQQEDSKDSVKDEVAVPSPIQETIDSEKALKQMLIKERIASYQQKFKPKDDTEDIKAPLDPDDFLKRDLKARIEDYRKKLKKTPKSRHNTAKEDIVFEVVVAKQQHAESDGIKVTEDAEVPQNKLDRLKMLRKRVANYDQARKSLKKEEDPCEPQHKYGSTPGPSRSINPMDSNDLMLFNGDLNLSEPNGSELILTEFLISEQNGVYEIVPGSSNGMTS